MWLSLLCNKSNLSLLFPNFKAWVENYSILQLSPYTQMAERNIQPFNPYLIPTAFNISKPPYTPQFNGSTKRWHRHIIETELTLLYQASIPLSYWSYAFLIATCLINKLPTPILSLVSPLEKLFSKQPNYHKQKKKLLSLLSLIASLYSSQTWSKSHPMYFSCPFISPKTLSLPRPLHEQVVTS